MNRLHKKYGKQVEFLLVYIREAHPSDGWQVQSNVRDGIVFEQPTTEAARTQVCQKFLADVKITIPPVIDGLDDAVGGAYSAWPDRLYLVDTAGKIAYQSGRGPWGFKPEELEEAIQEELK